MTFRLITPRTILTVLALALVSLTVAYSPAHDHRVDEVQGAALLHEPRR